MEMILSRENMKAAYRRVVRNKGAPGIDEMTVEQLKPYLTAYWPRIREELLAGHYRPAPVRGVEIPVNRRAKLTPDRRRILTPLQCATVSARPGGAGRGCAARSGALTGRLGFSFEIGA